MKKKLFRSGPYADFFSQGVLVDKLLTLAGQVGTDDMGNTPESIEAQMKNCYKNIKDILAEYGATMDNIIDEVWFVTDIEDCMQNVNDIFNAREEIYGCKPEVTQTLVGVTALVDPALKIEIKCTAYLD